MALSLLPDFGINDKRSINICIFGTLSLQKRQIPVPGNRDKTPTIFMLLLSQIISASSFHATKQNF
jgi:hypothetical protein